MEPIGNVIKQIVKQRNLGDEKTLENQALHDPDVQAFLKQNADKIDQKMIRNSMSNLYEFYSQKTHPNKVMVGYAPQLFLNGKVIDIRYAPTRAKIAQDRKKAAQRRLQLIDLPARLHDVSLSEIDVTDDRNNVLALIYDFLKKYKKDPHQKGLYLSYNFNRISFFVIVGQPYLSINFFSNHDILLNYYQCNQIIADKYKMTISKLQQYHQNNQMIQ